MRQLWPMLPVLGWQQLPGQPEHDLVRTVVHLGLDQPLILGLTRDEASDHALMLVLRYENGAAGR